MGACALASPSSRARIAEYLTTSGWYGYEPTRQRASCSGVSTCARRRARVNPHVIPNPTPYKQMAESATRSC